MNILLAEPNEMMSTVIARTLKDAGHEVTIASTATVMRSMLPKQPFSLVVFDDRMPGMTIIELTNMLQRLDSDINVLVLATPSFDKVHIENADIDSEAEMVSRLATEQAAHKHNHSSSASSALAAGIANVHDFQAVLHKPFSKAELLTHIRLLAMTSDFDARAGLLTHGDLTVDVAKQRAFYGDDQTPLPLSPREYATLETLIRAHGRFLAFDELLDTVFGHGVLEQRDSMETTLYHLIRKMRHVGMYITQLGDMYRIL